MKKIFIIFTIFIILSFQNLFAGGGKHYPNGVENFFSGIAPPPGFHLLNYNLFYHASKYKTNNGKSLNNFDVDVFGEVLRFIYISEKKILGGNYGQHLFIPYLYQHINAFGQTDTDKNFGDIIYSPFLLTFHKPKFHFAISLVDIYIPIGKYDKKDMLNAGKNFWTFEPVFALTYFPIPKLNISVKLMYDFNTTNHDYLNPATGKDSDLKPGQEFHMDYAVGYSITKALTVGLNGYFYYQTTDDKLDGHEIENQRSKVISIGPGIFYSLGKLKFSLNTNFEFKGKNISQGNTTVFKIFYSF